MDIREERLLKREGNLFTVIHTMSKSPSDKRGQYSAFMVYSLLRSTNSANCRQLPDYLDN